MEIKTRKGEKILVSECDYEHLKQFKWYLNTYICAKINTINYRIHRYIMIKLVGHTELTPKNYIDHINGNKLDNRRENLRIVTQLENSRNKTKRLNSSSKYFGVRKHKNKFITTLILNNETKLHATFDIEKHAAYQYDLWIKKYKITHTKINNIEKLDNFIQSDKIERKLPKYIFINKNKKFQIKYKTIHYGVYNTLDEAEIKLKKVKYEFEEKRIKEIEKIPIKRNEKDECIIELFNKKKEKVGETIIDEEIYYELIKYTWCLSNGYVSGNINKKFTRLHRYVMDYTGDNYIDHINNNKLDNRKDNLRIVTAYENSKNKISRKNSSSKYIGVNWDKLRNSWLVRISINGKCKNLGYFKDEIEAAKARDIATKEHYGEYGNLNFPNGIN